MNEQIFEILKCLVSLVCMCIGYLLIPYIKAKIYNTKYQNVVEQALRIVKALQQVYSDSTEEDKNTTKRIDAINALVNYANERGFKITTEQAATLIEDAVYTMKKTIEK